MTEPSPTLRTPKALIHDLQGRQGRGLLITRSESGLESALTMSFPRITWTVMTKDDLRGWGPKQLLGLLRDGSRAAVVVEDHAAEAERRRDLYRAVLVAARARSRWLLSGDTVEQVGPSAIPRLVGVGFAEAASSARGLLAAKSLSSRLRGGARPASGGGRRVAFLRTEFWFGVEAGGSVSHTLGVVGAMRSLGLEPRVWSSVPIPGVDALAKQTIVTPPARPAMIEEAALAAYNAFFVNAVRDELREFDPAVIYCRHAVFALQGQALARELGVPLVLEVNGSEVWARRAWSRLQFGHLAEHMERTALAAADRLTLISKPLVSVVADLGGHEDRMVVNPNGVDVDRFHAEDRSPHLRGELGFSPDQVVAGFTGTFHKWHGVVFLAERIADLVRARPELRFLWIGDGEFQERCRDIVTRSGVGDRCVFTGLVDPAAVPGLLQACDIVLSPHLPFEDGTEFFGSPTKLFEYMAAGRPVVASRLGQIADVVQDDETGILVEPGNAEEFDAAVLRLAADPDLRNRLGIAARKRAEQHYTWEANVRRSLDGFADLPGSGKQ